MLSTESRTETVPERRLPRSRADTREWLQDRIDGRVAIAVGVAWFVLDRIAYALEPAAQQSEPFIGILLEITMYVLLAAMLAGLVMQRRWGLLASFAAAILATAASIACPVTGHHRSARGGSARWPACSRSSPSAPSRCAGPTPTGRPLQPRSCGALPLYASVDAVWDGRSLGLDGDHQHDVADGLVADRRPLVVGAALHDGIAGAEHDRIESGSSSSSVSRDHDVDVDRLGRCANPPRRSRALPASRSHGTRSLRCRGSSCHDPPGSPPCAGPLSGPPVCHSSTSDTPPGPAGSYDHGRGPVDDRARDRPSASVPATSRRHELVVPADGTSTLRPGSGADASGRTMATAYVHGRSPVTRHRCEFPHCTTQSPCVRWCSPSSSSRTISPSSTAMKSSVSVACTPGRSGSSQARRIQRSSAVASAGGGGNVMSRSDSPPGGGSRSNAPSRLLAVGRRARRRVEPEQVTDAHAVARRCGVRRQPVGQEDGSTILETGHDTTNGGLSHAPWCSTDCARVSPVSNASPAQATLPARCTPGAGRGRLRRRWRFERCADVEDHAARRARTGS